MACRFGLRWIVAGAAGLVCAPLFAVELPSIRLDTVFPPGVRAGSEVEVAITGGDLEEADALRFTHPGITAKLKSDKHFTVTVSPDVPAGIYDARVSGLSGLSNPRAFVVGTSPETIKTKANNKPEEAADLPIDSVVSGTATAGANDYFKFTAKQGQRLIVECAAAQIDSRLSPVLALLDASGRELQTSRKGGLLDFTAPAEGVYLARLSDLSFEGGPDYFYRLSVSAGPHIDFIAPLSCPPGSKTKFTLYGSNLPCGGISDRKGADGKSLEYLDVEIEAPATGYVRNDGLAPISAAAVDGFSYRLKTQWGVSNPVFISFSSLPEIGEQKPNSAPAQAQKITLPCEIGGEFYPSNEAHWFTFDAKKGEVWWIEVFSHRLGMRTDPALVVKRGDEEVAAAQGPDAGGAPRRFNLASNDPAWRFEVKEDGAYRVAVSDLYANGQPGSAVRIDPRKAFRLSIHKEAPDFRLAAAVEPPPEKADDRIAVPNAALLRGSGALAIHVYAFRHDNFTGDIELSAEGLPAGVSCLPARILSGKNDGWLLLTAGEKPERWVGSIRVFGKAKAGDVELVHEARGGVVVWPVADIGTGAVRTRLTRDLALAVSARESAPVSVEPKENKVWETAPGGKLEIPLKVTRRGEFKDALKLKGAGAPGIETLKDLDIAAGATDATAVIDLASVKIPVGEHTIYFQSPTKGKFRGKDVSTTVYSVPIRISVKPPDSGTLPAVDAGKQSQP